MTNETRKLVMEALEAGIKAIAPGVGSRYGNPNRLMRESLRALSADAPSEGDRLAPIDDYSHHISRAQDIARAYAKSKEGQP